MTVGCKSSWGKNDINFIDDDDKIMDEPVKKDFDQIIKQTVKTKTIEVYSKDEVENVIDRLFNDLEKLFSNMNHNRKYEIK